MQGETTIHNIKGLHGNTEYLRLIFGLGGIAGVFLNVFYKNIKIAAPIILLPWFIAISSHSVVDVWNDMMPIQKEFDAVISWLAEFVELLIAATAFLHLVERPKNRIFSAKIDRLKYIRINKVLCLNCHYHQKKLF